MDMYSEMWMNILTHSKIQETIWTISQEEHLSGVEKLVRSTLRNCIVSPFKESNTEADDSKNS